MYRIESGIFIHYSHHVRGHSGPCISLHGHTWKFVLLLGARELDQQGFVLDFDALHGQVLVPCHQLLDHSLALGTESYAENREVLVALGRNLLASRHEILGSRGDPLVTLNGDLGGAFNELPGGIKVAVSPFTPTSERLAEWLYGVARAKIADGRVSVLAARVYESLHPVEMFAEYVPESLDSP
jgi:6-pyruvoyl-tetrahydropterin synthase